MHDFRAIGTLIPYFVSFAVSSSVLYHEGHKVKYARFRAIGTLFPYFVSLAVGSSVLYHEGHKVKYERL